MSTLERPRLRPYLAACQDDKDPRYVIIWDRLGLAAGPQRVTLLEFSCLQMFNGERSLRDIHTEAIGGLGEPGISLELIAALVNRMESALFLDSPLFRERLASPIREPSCIGCYAPDAAALRQQLRGLFLHRRGPGLPNEPCSDPRLRAVLVPHIDYTRGGPTFAWAFKEVYEHTDASLFVIIGTSHYSTHRFTLTRKHFKTPLGVVPTDQAYINRLVDAYGDGLFDDELAHLPEHSIELEVVFLQYLYETKRAFRIVPLVVGSFHDCVQLGQSPRFQEDIGRMVEALRRVESATNEPICYLISGDLAHIGPKFNDPEPVQEPILKHSQSQDQAILRQAETVDAEGYFRVIAGEGDCRRICGLPPTYTVLEALRPRQGKLLHYDQYVHPRGYESVSFASMAFYT